jgi:site-specific DNA recombinase
MEQALGYIRVSTNDQDFERQRDEVMRYAEKCGFSVVKVFEDKQSGSDYDDRRGFQDLLIYLDENPNIKIIIFDEISRMGRDTAMQVTTYKALTKKGVRVFTRGKGEFGSNKEDNLLFTVLSAIADYEKQTIIDRTSSGRRKVVRDGFTQISNRPYGYNLIFTKKKNRQVLKRQFIEINEEEAKHVRKMFEIVAKNGSVYDVLRYLRVNRVKPTKSKAWGKSSVQRVLHSTTYYGEWQFGKFVKNHKSKYSLSKRPADSIVVVNIPSIITKPLYDQVQERLDKNRIKFNPRNQKVQFVFKGLLQCACGGTMQTVAETRTGERLYRCPQRNIEGISKKTCPIKTIKADYLESILLGELKEKIGHVDFLKDLRKKKLDTLMEPVKALEIRKEEVKRDQEKSYVLLKGYYEKSVEMQSENPVKVRALDELAESMAKKMNSQKIELEELEKKIIETREKSIDYAVFKDIQQALRYIKDKDLELFGSGVEKKIEFARSYIQTIRLTYREKETDVVREQIMKLRKGLYKKENKGAKELYYTVANKEHQLRNTATQVIGLIVQFANNYCQDLQMLYYHEKPEIVRNYQKEGKARVYRG